MVPASPNCSAIFFFIYKSNTEATNFRIILYVYVMCMVCKSPEMTPCGWRGYKPSINKQIILLLLLLTNTIYDLCDSPNRGIGCHDRARTAAALGGRGGGCRSAMHRRRNCAAIHAC